MLVYDLIARRVLNVLEYIQVNPALNMPFQSTEFNALNTLSFVITKQSR